jgi:hypothetical protein
MKHKYSIIVLVNIYLPILAFMIYKSENPFIYSNALSFISALLSLAYIAVSKKTIQLPRNIIYPLILLLYMVSEKVVNSNYSISSLYTIVVFLDIIIIKTVMHNVSSKINRNIISYTIIIMIFILIFDLTLDYTTTSSMFHSDRYKGFSISSTTFSIYLLLLIQIFISSNKFRYQGVIYIIAIIIIFFTRTRSTIILLPVLFLINRYFRINEKKASLIVLTILFSILLIFPSIDYFDNALGSSQLSVFNRSDQNDNSLSSRIFYYSTQKELILKNTVIQHLFGNGHDSSIQYFSSLKYGNFKPHNDYFVIYYEHGLLMFVIFLLFLFKEGRKSKYVLSFIVIYMFSFYHNMAFNIYTINLVLIGSGISMKVKSHHERGAKS